jgi:hypothetical protein
MVSCSACLAAVAAAGTFKLTLEFSEDYPNKAPVVKFKSTMFHPNSECCAPDEALWCAPMPTVPPVCSVDPVYVA